MKEPTITRGEDFTILGEATFDPDETNQSLDDFEIVLALTTSAAGKRIAAFTEQDREGDAAIERLGGNAFSVGISHELTEQLTPGELTLSVALVHKVNGTRIIAAERSLTVLDSNMEGVL